MVTRQSHWCSSRPCQIRDRRPMQDISRNFSFACLRHLNNERGRESPDAVEGDDKVGGFWGLEVRALHPPPSFTQCLIDLSFLGFPRSKGHISGVRRDGVDPVRSTVYT